MKQVLILHKLAVIFMIVLLSFGIKFKLEKDNFKVSRSEDMKNVYIQINDSKYIRHELHSNELLTIEVKENDQINLIMVENSTITYKWMASSLDIFDAMPSIILISEEKISSSAFNPFQDVSEGENHDQKKFSYKINTREDTKISFSYVNTYDTSQSSFNFDVLLDAN